MRCTECGHEYRGVGRGGFPRVVSLAVDTSAHGGSRMSALDLAAEYRAQSEYFCAVPRYSLYAEENDCEKGEDLRLQTVAWADVADWEVPRR